MAQQNIKQIIKQEYIKCAKDPAYFMKKYCMIQHPTRGRINFNLYPFQEKTLSILDKNDRNIILKSRQLGISTLAAGKSLHKMLFNRDSNVLVIATKQDTAKNLVTKVKFMYDELPSWLKIGFVEKNKLALRLKNGSQIKASSTSSDAGRSEALSLLVIDEAAHVDGLDELWMGLYPTLSTGGRCIALSTPNGVGNWFHKTYSESAAGTNDFFPTVLPWDKHPDRDQQWFEKETKNMSRREIAQELECNFNMSGETVFHGDDLNRIEETVSEPKYKTGFDRNLWIWENAVEGQEYLISADVARGDGQDYSVFHVIKLSNMEIVAEYRGKITPDLFSKVLFDAGREYGFCMVVVENNSVGYSVLEKLKECEYPNIYYSIKSSHEYIDQVQAEYKSNAVAGFTTSMKTRPIIIAKMEEFIRNILIIIHSSRMLDEMKTFIWKNGRPEAMRSYNDDLVMACAVACWVRDTALVVNKRDLEYNKVFLSSMIKNDTTLNTTINGMHGYKNKSLSDTMKEHDKNYKDYPWLFNG